MKTISIVEPCYNEEENVIPLSRAITALFEKELADYRYKLILSIMIRGTGPGTAAGGSASPDIKAILTPRISDQFNSPYYAMLQTSGDCTILMAAGFQ